MATPCIAPIITPKLPGRQAPAGPLELKLETYPMEWSRTDTLPIADHRCTFCHGLGLRNGILDATQPCNCVLRAIFRRVYERFQSTAMKEKSLSRVTFDAAKGTRRAMWGRKDEEFLADFLLVSKRALKRNKEQYQLYRLHFLLGADWRLCIRHLGISKGEFFHMVYRIEQKLGRVYRELLPYPLYPLDEYFNGAMLDHAQIRKMRAKRRAEIEDGADNR